MVFQEVDTACGFIAISWKTLLSLFVKVASWVAATIYPFHSGDLAEARDAKHCHKDL